MEIVIEIFKSGLNALFDYLLKHTITCLIPAFFIAGAISSFITKEAVLRYFGKDANKYLAYLVASVSGAILAVCSCTVLPLFAGIYRIGAGFGPAITFLYAGPAINVLAIVYSYRVLGLSIGIARTLGAIVLSIIIGLLMENVFFRETKKSIQGLPATYAANGGQKQDVRKVIFVGILVIILLTLTAKISFYFKIAGFLLELAFVFYAVFKWFSRDELNSWLFETWKLFKMITPLLLVGVFLAGVLKELVPEAWIAGFVGNNTILANFLASLFGALMYFATLTEVPIIKALMELGMNKGPVLSLLLAGPALSLPAILALSRIMGVKKTFVYLTLVVVFSTIAGFIFGMI